SIQSTRPSFRAMNTVQARDHVDRYARRRSFHCWLGKSRSVLVEKPHRLRIPTQLHAMWRWSLLQQFISEQLHGRLARLLVRLRKARREKIIADLLEHEREDGRFHFSCGAVGVKRESEEVAETFFIARETASHDGR